MKINRLGLVAMVAVGFLCCGLASAQEGKEGKGKRAMPSVQERLDRMTTELSLTEDQKPKIKAAMEAADKKRQELFADSSVQGDQRREKVRAIMDEQDKKFKEILKPDQYEKWEKLRAQMGGRGGNGKKKGEGKKE